MKRRDFLKAALLATVGIGVNVSGLARLQDESLPFDTDADGHLVLDGKIKRVHDPAIIKADDAYYVFSTGRGIPVRKSTDLINWETPFPSVVFGSIPEWARDKIPGQNDIWAPDISFYNGKYHLYYSVSTFGQPKSVIGLATNKTLDSESEDFEWVDEGLVIASTGAENYNCIDPNLVLDEDGNPWLAFGSFWSGIKMIRLDLETGKQSTEDDTLYSLAQRAVNSGSVEAPFVIRKGDFYYLFVSFDFCCRGVDSTYRVMVGRSETVTGPYVDRDGVEMLKGGGTQVTFATDRWRGPGHNGILEDDGTELIVYHSYDANNAGVFTMRIAPLTWDDEGWPSITTEE
jgi:arabinan endo-1,5-alpha-L-arabinosidase